MFTCFYFLKRNICDVIYIKLFYYVLSLGRVFSYLFFSHTRYWVYCIFYYISDSENSRNIVPNICAQAQLCFLHHNRRDGILEILTLKIQSFPLTLTRLRYLFLRHILDSDLKYSHFVISLVDTKYLKNTGNSWMWGERRGGKKNGRNKNCRTWRKARWNVTIIHDTFSGFSWRDTESRPFISFAKKTGNLIFSRQKHISVLRAENLIASHSWET